MAFALSLNLDPTFGINSHKTLGSAQLDYILKTYNFPLLTILPSQTTSHLVFITVTCVCVRECCLYVYGSDFPFALHHSPSPRLQNWSSKLAFSTQCCLYALCSLRLLDGCGFFFWLKSYFMSTVSLQSVGLCLSVRKGTLSKVCIHVSWAFRMSLPMSTSQMHIIITVSL